MHSIDDNKKNNVYRQRVYPHHSHDKFIESNKLKPEISSLFFHRFYAKRAEMNFQVFRANDSFFCHFRKTKQKRADKRIEKATLKNEDGEQGTPFHDRKMWEIGGRHVIGERSNFFVNKVFFRFCSFSRHLHVASMSIAHLLSDWYNSRLQLLWSVAAHSNSHTHRNRIGMARGKGKDSISPLMCRTAFA